MPESMSAIVENEQQPQQPQGCEQEAANKEREVHGSTNEECNWATPKANHLGQEESTDHQEEESEEAEDRPLPDSTSPISRTSEPLSQGEKQQQQATNCASPPPRPMQQPARVNHSPMPQVPVFANTLPTNIITIKSPPPTQEPHQQVARKNKFSKGFRRMMDKVSSTVTHHSPAGENLNNSTTSATETPASELSIRERSKTTNTLATKWKTITERVGGQKSSSTHAVSLKMNLFVPPSQLQSSVRVCASRTRHAARIVPASCSDLGTRGPTAKIDSAVHSSQEQPEPSVQVDLVRFSVYRTGGRRDSQSDDLDHDVENIETRTEPTRGALVPIMLDRRGSSSQQQAADESETVVELEWNQETDEQKHGPPALLDYLRLGLIDIREGERLTVLGLYTEPRFLVRNAIGQCGLVKLSDLDSSDHGYWTRELMDKAAIETFFEQ